MAHHKEVDNLGTFSLKVLTLLGIGTVLISEGLSVFSLITPACLSFAWYIYILGLAYVFRTHLTRQYVTLKKVNLKTALSTWGLGERFVLGALVLNVVILLFVALLCPPNTWDSMTYHMSRVAHWAEQHSLAHYPTGILRQLYISPWAEYAILQPYVIWGTDRFSNLVQWIGFIGTLVAIAQLTKEWGGNKKTQLYAAAFFATMPMALLQATSTQTDLISAFWVCSTVLFLIRREILFFSMCFALALFSKTSNALYLFPFCLWGLYLLKKDGKSFIYITRSVLVLIAITTLVHSAHFYRNYASFGSIAGPAKEVKGMNNESINPLMTLSNVVRNYTLNLGTPSEAVNDELTNLVRGAIGLVGIDPDDKRFSFGSNYRFSINKTSTHEDHAPNPYQAWILLFALPLFFLFAPKGTSRTYGLISLSSFYVLCMFLRASPWNHRLHLPFFALMAPMFGLALQQSKQTILRGVLQVSLVGSVLLSFYWSLCNYSKPVLHPKPHYPQSILATSREDLYFYNRSYIKDAYLETLEILRTAQCTHLGLQIGLDHWEYPFWAVAKLRSQKLTVTHLVGNQTSTLPCALFISGEQNTPLVLGGVIYSVNKSFPGEFSHFTLLLPDPKQ